MIVIIDAGPILPMKPQSDILMKLARAKVHYECYNSLIFCPTNEITEK